jgi:Uma2 family endonuclease
MTSSSPRRHRYTLREYLDLEEASNLKHEFLDGEIYAMAGGTPEHAALTVAVAAALLAQLQGGPCRVFSSDLRVRILPTGLATYPDITVVCGPLERDPEGRTTVTNPTVVVEVLSESTEAFDRGEKLEHYKQAPSLRECLLVSQTEPRLEVHRREPDGRWSSHAWRAGETARLTSLNASLDLDALYATALGAGLG